MHVISRYDFRVPLCAARVIVAFSLPILSSRSRCTSSFACGMRHFSRLSWQNISVTMAPAGPSAKRKAADKPISPPPVKRALQSNTTSKTGLRQL